MRLADVVAQEILPRVERPSRYLGTELNSVHKDPSRVDLRVCLAFPDSYDLGLGNLGLQILYHILNQDEAVWCERVCAPHPDLEALLRQRGLPLFSLESKTALHEFDLLGFTLQWELNYTNILNLLDLGGIPLHSDERTDQHPIVAAGGPCVFNPEPLAMFIDVFVLGDGEEAILELAETVRQGGGRRRILERLAALPGFYVPALYPMRLADNNVLVKPDGAPTISKLLVRDLDAAPFPTDYLVPYGEQVHDRVGLEVLRGCTQGCRFCQAGMVTRPVRERSLETLAQLQQQTMRQTGYEEISLVSLSTCDYSKVKSLVRQSVDLARPDHISVGLPSLRLDSFSVDLAHQISSVRKTGLTFAPEAATDRMRAVINKFISSEELLDMARQCYGHGWELVKLYFMIGLPTEQDEDVEAIAELATRVWEVGRGFTSRARINLGVSTFIPKPQTPFQWCEQIGLAETERRQRLLHGKLRPKGIKFGRHDAFGSYLEGILTRGDRRVGWLLQFAWEAGARFDGWYELANDAAWQTAFARWEEHTGLRVEDQLRARQVDEPLPWDHIDVLIPKAWLQQDWQRAQEQAWAADCRQAKCHQCGVIQDETKGCTTMLRQSREGAREEATLAPADPPQWEEPPAVAKMRFRWRRDGLARLLSHKETMNVFIRALRRARVPMKYSEGYHPHASLSFSGALPVGVETEGDWCDVTLTASTPPQSFVDQLNATLPDGFAVLEAWEVPPNAKAPDAILSAARYRVTLPPQLAPLDLAARADAWLDRDAVVVSRRGKSKGRPVLRPIDVRPMVRELAVARLPGGGAVLELVAVEHNGRPLKVRELLETLLDEPEAEALTAARVRRLATYLVEDGELREPRPLIPECVA